MSNVKYIVNFFPIDIHPLFFVIIFQKNTVFAEFIFADDHQVIFCGINFCGSPNIAAFCGIYFCVLGPNPHELIPQ